jgi:hypothetical protein
LYAYFKYDDLKKQLFLFTLMLGSFIYQASAQDAMLAEGNQRNANNKQRYRA